jgi:hypothetical protein
MSFIFAVNRRVALSTAVQYAVSGLGIAYMSPFFNSRTYHVT